jgi:hypothetical protein
MTMARHDRGRASVTMDAEMFDDLRFDRLARLAGLADGDHARGKFARIVKWNTDHFDEWGYVVPTWVVDQVLGDRGADALIGSMLAEYLEDGLRLRGSDGRVEWYARLRNTRVSGGVARERTAARTSDGKFVSRTTLTQHDLQQDASKTPAAHEHQSSAQAQAQKEISASQRGGGEVGDLLAHSDPQKTTAAAQPPLKSPSGWDQAAVDRRKLGDEIWDRFEAARTATATQNGQKVVRLGDQSIGRRDLADRILEWTHLVGIEETRRRCEHVLVRLIADAKAKKTCRWLDGKAWSKERAEMVLGWPVIDEDPILEGTNGLRLSEAVSLLEASSARLEKERAEKAECERESGNVRAPPLRAGESPLGSVLTMVDSALTTSRKR